MYIALYHTHKLAITIFILIYLVKTFLLLTGRHEPLKNFSAKIRPFEIVVSSLFLITGIFLLFETSEIRPLFIGKLFVVILAVPLAFIGFKKGNKALGTLSLVLLLSAYGLAEMNKRAMVKRLELPKDIITDTSNQEYNIMIHGKALYDTQCVVCHGEAGTLQMSGAKDLTKSEFNKEQVQLRIKEGKLTMPEYGDYFNESEIKAIAEYTLTLMKKKSDN